MISCFLPYISDEQVTESVASLHLSPLVSHIYLLTVIPHLTISLTGCTVLQITGLQHSDTLRLIAHTTKTPYTLLYLKDTPFILGMNALERMIKVATDTAAEMIYADSYRTINGIKKAIPLIDYQMGSVRDDFDFGSLLLYSTAALKTAVREMNHTYLFAGLYDLRLRLSQHQLPLHINELLYTEVEHDNRKSGEKQFDYVDPKNRAVQIEMEAVCTDYLKRIGAYLSPCFKKLDLHSEPFAYEASVIIPVYNRVRTIGDAISSVLSQKADFSYNIIVIDNHSTDGTSQIIEQFTQDARVIHLIPNRDDLGIGGCWNWGVADARCGKFAIQLDSDDVYSDENTISKIVAAFYEQQCAMVIGSYLMTNFKMEEIPPGKIDHKEWTPENGRNNALRINGLGAPRAFYTPILREIKVPNTSYGEDYALGLQFSRYYQIGRLYDVLYRCRRWDENSDASLDIYKMNTYNGYKDKLRTWEINSRITLNLQKEQ